ncbi:MAG TPA: hypothetical protein VLL52_04460 [Anaerolineae bacterium]|nr:hypothetical protein [Anaerolineae bacterium]
MPKINRLITLLFLTIFLVACANADNEPVATPNPDNANPNPPVNPTTETDTDTPLPTATSLPSDYPPATPVPPPTTNLNPDAYPDMADTVWILRPQQQQQCNEDGSAVPFTYSDLDAAVMDLQTNGIVVNDATVTNLLVCEACTCPSSTHYRANINRTNLDAAENLGWFTE